MKDYKTLLCVLIISALTGCGSGSSSDDTSESLSTKSTGVFLDSPVINIGYRTETLEGVTNLLGEYEYIEGETVTFFIGDLEFPSTAASGTVTPLELSGVDDVTDSKVVNMIRLLQTLDKDADPSNGLTITDAAKSTATEVDFTLSVFDFENSTAVDNLIENAGQDVAVSELVSAEDAIAHFESTLESRAKFIAGEISDGEFSVSFDDGPEILEFYFSTSGGGMVDHGDSIESLTWLINSAGALAVTFGDYTDTYTLVSGSSFVGNLSIHIFDNKQEITDSITTGTITKIEGIFTEAAIVGSSFSVSFDDGDEVLVYDFSVSGTGTVDYGDGESDIAWLINSEGALLVTFGDYTDTYTLVTGSSSSGTLDIHIYDNVNDVTDSTTTGSIARL